VADEPKKKRRGRRLLIVALPLALVLAGGYFWATGGRYIATEDAYVQQDRVTVMPQVSGQIATVLAGENEAVAAG
jgi:membrane fusion protein (multidrug efflux system)